MPPELKVVLQTRAKSHGRTLNAEINIILQRAVNDSGFRLSLGD